MEFTFWERGTDNQQKYGILDGVGVSEISIAESRGKRVRGLDAQEQPVQ